MLHCAVYITFCAGTVAGTVGDQPVNVYPSLMTGGAVNAVPYTIVALVPPSPPFASKIIVYWLTVHCAVYVASFVPTVPGTVGVQPVNVYPALVTVGAESVEP